MSSIVRDDASEDGTVGLLHAFARRVPFRVEVVAGDRRLGYAQNFVAASQACRGSLVFFADQDDVVAPRRSWPPSPTGYAAARRWRCSTTSP